MKRLNLHHASEDLLWYWITERHLIYLRRKEGRPKPWTGDPILQQYKFTNPFRENDRGTVWLRENFLEPHASDRLELLVGNVCWYRMFNWWQTGEVLGWQTEWDMARVIAILNEQKECGEQVFTGAHIVYSPPGWSKIDAIANVCEGLWKLSPLVVEIAQRERTMEAVFNVLTSIYCVGGFMGYEMVTDLRHTRLLDTATDLMTWANIGPGAKRGLHRLGLPVSLDSMRTLLEHSRTELPPVIPALELRDIEHSLCEFDKYSRVKFHEGEPRSKFDGV